MRKDENKSFKTVLVLLGVFLVFGIGYLIFSMIFSNEKYLSSENITVVSNASESQGNWDRVEKVEIKTVGIAVDSYSFDGGINWQDSNEYYATEKQTLVIVVKDVNGKQSEPIEYETMNMDSTPPIISVKLPSKVALNSKINLGEYVSASDENSGIDGTITMTPSSLDTSKVGKKKITFSAKDKAGNISTIDVTIEVVNMNAGNTGSGSTEVSVAKTLYRYRVKNATEYVCKTYDCSYYEEGEKASSEFKTDKCTAENTKIRFNDGCYITPGDPNEYCTQAIINVDRYKTYKSGDWTYTIDIFALGKDGKQVNSPGSGIIFSKDENGNYTTDSMSDGFSSIDYSNSINMSTGSIYKAEPCDENEISIYGYCHAICSGTTSNPGCKSGYTMVDGKCQKRVEKTCRDTCTKYTWSSWSEWSETIVTPSETVQVETKVVNE